MWVLGVGEMGDGDSSSGRLVTAAEMLSLTKHQSWMINGGTDHSKKARLVFPKVYQDGARPLHTCQLAKTGCAWTHG